MTSVLFKMEDVNAEYFKVKLKNMQEKEPRQSLVTPNSDPLDRFVYSIHKLDRFL